MVSEDLAGHLPDTDAYLSRDIDVVHDSGVVLALGMPQGMVDSSWSYTQRSMVRIERLVFFHNLQILKPVGNIVFCL